MKKTIALALTLAAISTSALAGSPWVEYSKTKNGAKFWYMPQSVLKMGNTMRVDTMQRVGYDVQSSRKFIDCKTWTYENVWDDGTIDRNMTIMPDSPINTLATIVCK